MMQFMIRFNLPPHMVIALVLGVVGILVVG